MKDRFGGNGDPSLVGPDVIVAVAETERGREQHELAARMPVKEALFVRVVGDGLAEIEPGYRFDHREVSESGWRDEPDALSLFPAGSPRFRHLSHFRRRLFTSRPVFEASGAPHPRQGTDRAHPVGEGRDEAEVQLHMLFADPAGRYDAPGRERQRRAVKRLQHEDALGVVPERPVPEIRGNRLRLVDYVDSHQQ
jgi:hypothetical protein